jgi:hypothetical protein
MKVGGLRLIMIVGLFVCGLSCKTSVETATQFRAQDTAESVMKEYLRLRLKQADSYKRYNLLSKRVRASLKQDSKVSNQEEFRNQISDEEQWLDTKIISFQKRTANEMRVIVWCKAITEHPDGGKVSESQREFVVVKEDNYWWLDSMIIDGWYYYP